MRFIALCCLATPAYAEEPPADETIEIVDEAPLAPAATPPATIRGDEVRVMAGARGDAIEAVRNLPGVAFATSGQGSTGDLAIRGTSGSDSWYLIDGITVPSVMHLATSILPVELVQSIELYPGGFDVAYGRATGGVIELSTTRPRSAGTRRWETSCGTATPRPSSWLPSRGPAS
jgi:outer membrane receptor protein involved in Fe transport